jgi:hypothetical protein
MTEPAGFPSFYYFSPMINREDKPWNSRKNA